MNVRLICFFVLLLACKFGLLSQDIRGVNPIHTDAQKTNNTYAIIIGISDYKNIVDLNFADRDASAFYHLLNTLKGPNDPQQYELFLNEKANRFNICDAISKLLIKAKAGDQVFFYFAGHGDIEDLSQSKNGLLLLFDSPRRDYFGMTDGVLQVSQLADYFGNLTSRGVEVYFIIDACHSGKLTGGKEGWRHTSNAIRNTLANEGTVLLSCDADQLSLEGSEWGEGRGLFSFYLQEGLLGLADIDNDQQVSLIELEQYVKRNTYLESDKRQTPVFAGKQNKILARIEKHVRDSIVDRKSRELKEFKQVYLKGNEENYLAGLDSTSLYSYYRFNSELRSGNFIKGDTNAYFYYVQFNKNNPDHYLTSLLKRKLMISLNISFDSIVRPLLIGRKSTFTLSDCKTVLYELDTCLALMGASHYMYSHVLSRKYFIESLIESYGINLNNFGPLSLNLIMNSIQTLHFSRSLEPNASYVYLYLGIQYQTAQNWDSSMYYFEKFSRLIPNSEIANNLMGITLWDMGRTKESVNLLRKAISQNQDYIEAYTNLIYVYTKLGLIQEAIAAAQEVIRRRPTFTSAYNNLALLYLEQGNFKKALEYIHISESINPKNPLAIFIKGKIHYYGQKFEDADSCFRQCIHLKVDYADAYYYSGINAKEQGNLTDALKQFKAYTLLDQQNPVFYKEIADCFRLLHEKDSAQFYYDISLRLLQRQQSNPELAGEIYQFGLREYEKAKEYFDSVQSTDVFFLLKKWSNLIYLQKEQFTRDEPRIINQGYFVNSVNHYLKACIAAGKKDLQAVIRNLRMSIRQCNSLKVMAALDSNFDQFRDQILFKDLLFPFQ